MSAQTELFPELDRPITIADLADFIFRETCYAVLHDQIGPESLCTPGAASHTVSTLVRSLRPDQAREWITRSGIKPLRARKAWLMQMERQTQAEIDRRVQALLGIGEAAA